jgi:competence ComEA-like helix-hairpin-helix protein
LEELKKNPYFYKTAKAIIAYREQHGKFQNAQDLLKTKVLDEEQLKKITPYLSF